MDKLSIREFRPEDLVRLHEIRSRAFAPVFASFRELIGQRLAATALATAETDQGAWLDTICAAGSGHVVLVAEDGERIAGFVSYATKPERRTAEIGLNAVDPDYAHRGIGTRLYDEALRRLKASGVLAVEVGTGLDDSHAPARRAYAKAGFGPAIPSVTLYRWLGD